MNCQFTLLSDGHLGVTNCPGDRRMLGVGVGDVTPCNQITWDGVYSPVVECMPLLPASKGVVRHTGQHL